MGEASSRLGLYSGNQREAILDPREKQPFVQGLCRAPLRSPLQLGDKKRRVGAAAALAQEGERSCTGSSCLQGEVQTLQHLGWAPTTCWVHGQLPPPLLHSAGEAQRWQCFALGHWAGKWPSWGGNQACLTPKPVSISFLGGTIPP